MPSLPHRNTPPQKRDAIDPVHVEGGAPIHGKKSALVRQGKPYKLLCIRSPDLKPVRPAGVNETWESEWGERSGPGGAGWINKHTDPVPEKIDRLNHHRGLVAGYKSAYARPSRLKSRWLLGFGWLCCAVLCGFC